MGDGFYRSKDPTNSITVLKEATKENNTKNKENTKFTCIDTQKVDLDLASDHNMAYRLLRVDLIKAVSTSVHPSFIITVTTDNLLLLFLLLITVYQFLLSNL